MRPEDRGPKQGGVTFTHREKEALEALTGERGGDPAIRLTDFTRASPPGRKNGGAAGRLTNAVRREHIAKGAIGPDEIDPKSVEVKHLDPAAGIFHLLNILGVVAFTGADPSGALFEQGSNANGTYLKVAGRAVVAWQDRASLAGAWDTWTFPVPVIAAPFAICTVHGSSVTLREGRVHSTSLADVSFGVIDATPALVAVNVRLLMVGLWA